MSQIVADFEREFAAYVGAGYAIALCNGTATLHTALVAMGVKPGDRVAVPPLTMSSTTIAVLHAGAVPVFCDVMPDTWVMGRDTSPVHLAISVSLYGLSDPSWDQTAVTVDAAQTLAKHGAAAFTSYSFQASKILALDEGGMLVTNDGDLAQRAREFSSLGYRMDANQPRIDKAALKHPGFERHHSLGYNYRMSKWVAMRGLTILPDADRLLARRREAAEMYRHAIRGCEWLTPQHVPDGWTHDYWTYAVACDTPERALWLLDAVERNGGERPYPAWRLAYDEPAFHHLRPSPQSTERWAGFCPVAESLQPRLVQFQTNDLASAGRNARALRRAIGIAS